MGVGVMNNQDIAAQVASAGGLKKVSLGDLRKELGYDRLGRWVVEEISDTLEEKGLGYFPRAHLNPALNEAPRQWQEVWVYVRDDGPRARVLDAVLAPEGHDVEVALAGLADDATSLSAEQKVERIRQIVAGV